MKTAEKTFNKKNVAYKGTKLIKQMQKVSSKIALLVCMTKFESYQGSSSESDDDSDSNRSKASQNKIFIEEITSVKFILQLWSSRNRKFFITC